MARVGPQALRWFAFPGGLREMGHLPEDDGAFCFDNETPRHRAWAERTLQRAEAFGVANEDIGFVELLAAGLTGQT